jgi:glycosyltransferase involved in cell wall biosynthesis
MKSEKIINNKKIKVLYLVPFIKPFILNPITELLDTNEIDCIIDFHFSVYSFFRNQILRKMVLEYRNDKKNQSQKKHLTFFPGLPKNFLSHYYPNWIAKVLEYKYREKKFDLIHAHTLLPSGFVAYKLSKKWKIPFIVTSHGMDFYRCLPDVNKYRNSKQYNYKELKKINIVLNKSNYIIAVSKNYAKQITEYNSKANVKVIENSYNKDIFYKIKRGDARKKLSISLNDKILISTGNFVKSKGHIYLLQAMNEVIKKYPDIKLYIIGGGILWKKYNRFIEGNNLKKNIFLINEISQGELALWNNSADIFTFPSISESFGVALIEAMTCGVPVIAADATGPQEIIDNYKTGIIVPKQNSQELAKKILLLISNNNLREKLSKNAMNEVKKKFAKKNFDYLNLYKELINNHE